MWIIASLFLLISIILLYGFYSRLTVEVNMKKVGQQDRIDLMINVFNGLYKKKIAFPLIKKEGPGVKVTEKTETQTKTISEEKIFTFDDVEKAKKTYQHFLKKYHHAKKHLAELVDKLRVDKVETKIQFGVGAADYTAMLSGLIWMIHGWSRLFIERKLTLACKPHHQVIPVYGATVFKMTASCIVSIRLGHLIIIGFRLWLDRGTSKHKKVGEVHGASY